MENLTSNVAVRLVCLEAGDTGVIHAQLHVAELLAELLNVALLAVQLHLQLIAVRALLRQLLLREASGQSDFGKKYGSVEHLPIVFCRLLELGQGF